MFSKQDFQRWKPKKTKKAQRNLNEKNAKKRLIRLINENFTIDDWAIHLTYSNQNRPSTIEKAEKEVYKYIRKINYRRKKMGLPNAKWIYVTEYDPQKKIKVHHHLLMEKGIDRKVMKDLWTNGTRTEIKELEPDEYGLTGLANYISKDPKGKKKMEIIKRIKTTKREKKLYVFFKKEN